MIFWFILCGLAGFLLALYLVSKVAKYFSDPTINPLDPHSWPEYSDDYDDPFEEEVDG